VSSPITSVLHYLQLLYSKDSDAGLRRAADEWLKSYVHSSEAWSVAPALLEHESEVAQFYGASVLDAKIVDAYADLESDDDVAALRDALFRYIERYSTAAAAATANAPARTGAVAARNKLCRAMAAFAVQCVPWHASLLADLTARLSATPALVHAQLLILTELPNECENRRLFVPLQHRQALQARLSASAPQLIAHLVDCMTLANGNAALQAAVFNCLGTLLRKCQVPLATLVGNPLVHAPFQALAQPDLFDAAVELVCDLLRLSGDHLRQLDDDGGAGDDEPDDGAGGEPDSDAEARAGAQALASALLPHVLALKDVFVTDQVDKSDDDVFKAYTRIFAETGEYYAREFVAVGSEAAIGLVSVLLMCAAHESVEVFAVTSRFWSHLARVLLDSDERRAVFAPAYEQLLVVLRGHMRYDADYERWTRDQLSDFDDLRRKGLSDALHGCAEVLGAEAALVATCDATEQLMATAHAPWPDVEAALYAVRALARMVERRARNTVDSVALRAVSLMIRLSEQEQQHHKVMYTALLIIGRYASFLATDEGRVFLTPVMNAITAALMRPETLGAAAVALNNVCQDCTALLVDARDSLLQLYHHVAAQGTLQLDDSIELVEGIARVIRLVADPSARVLSMQQLCLPLIRLVEQADAPPKAFEFAVKLLAAAFKNAATGRTSAHRTSGTMLHLPDPTPVDAEASDPLFALFSELWPLLATVLGDRLHDDSAVIAVSKLVRDAARELPATSVAALAPTIFARLSECFSQRPHAELVHIASSLVNSIDRAAVLIDALGPLVERAFECMRSVNAMQAFPDVVCETFILALALLWSSPLPFASSALADMFVQAGVEGLMCENPAVSRHVTSFFMELLIVAVPPNHLGTRAAQTIDVQLAQALSASLMQTLGRHVPALLTALVKGLAGLLPMSHCHQIAAIMRRLRRLDPTATHEALRAILASSLSNLDAAHKEAFSTSFLHAEDRMFDACEAFAHACRQRKRWMP
jgi:transportin-3